MLSAGHPVWLRVTASKLAARVAYVQVRRTGAWRNAHRVVLGLRPRAVRVPLARGPWSIRLYVAGESAPQGSAFATAAVAVRVR
jgi:hypothetical protein